MTVQARSIEPAEQVEAPTLATVLADPAYATGTHAEIADAINAATVDVPRTALTVKEIIAALDPAEIANLTHPGFWKILDSAGEFDVAGKELALLSAMLPPDSLKALEAYAASSKTVPLWATLGFSRPLDGGDVSNIRGHEPDVFDAASGENQCASGLTSDQRAAIIAANARVDAKVLVANYTKRQLDVFASLSRETLTACGVDPAAVDIAKTLQVDIATLAKANPDIDVSEMTKAQLTAEVAP